MQNPIGQVNFPLFQENTRIQHGYAFFFVLFSICKLFFPSVPPTLQCTFVQLCCDRLGLTDKGKSADSLPTIGKQQQQQQYPYYVVQQIVKQIIIAKYIDIRSTKHTYVHVHVRADASRLASSIKISCCSHEHSFFFLQLILIGGVEQLSGN